MSRVRAFVALDIGEVRIGVAVADDDIRIAIPFETVEVATGEELAAIGRILLAESADVVIVGYPRNQSGDPTAQTALVEAFVGRLKQYIGSFDRIPEIVYQDESLTSVLAEERLKSSDKPYAKGDIDREAAAIILQDYLETRA
ncbi:MAG: Holliday junction resolvase RuvX [Candidatus Saccharimonadales bacterium]